MICRGSWYILPRFVILYLAATYNGLLAHITAQLGPSVVQPSLQGQPPYTCGSRALSIRSAHTR